MTTVTLTDTSPADIVADALVVATVRGTDGAGLAAGHGLPRKSVTHLEAVLAALEATGDPDEVHRVVSVPGVRATSVVLTGLGDAVTGRGAAYAPGALRSAAGAALRALTGKRTVAVALPAHDLAALGAVADGAYAGCYRFTAHKSAKPARTGRPVRAGADGPVISVVSALTGRGATAEVKRAAIVAAARDFTRDLVNTPPNHLVPQTFVEAVRERVGASPGKVTLTVLDEKALIKGGFGGIVGVGQGSVHPPRIVAMSYRPSRPASTLALVGKGITFDSGGLCIKTAAGMLTMKSDMAGAAAVAATVIAAAELKVPVAVTGYLCLAENMPSGTAQRPGDVVTMRNGTTVEIIDTDAEGRMVLADGICLAGEAGPDAIVDIATLTGAQMVALGPEIAAVMANDDTFRTELVAAADAAAEPAWPMPLPEQLRKGLDSPTADLAHKADRWGGMLTAGIFLGEFVGEGIPWAHVDIAGPSFNEKGAFGYTPKGGTGYGVATLLALIEGRAS